MDTIKDPVERNFSEYELASEPAGPVFQLVATYAFRCATRRYYSPQPLGTVPGGAGETNGVFLQAEGDALHALSVLKKGAEPIGFRRNRPGSSLPMVFRNMMRAYKAFSSFQKQDR